KEILNKVNSVDMRDKIVTLRVKGVLESGRISDVDFKGIIERCYEKGAYAVLKNANALTTKELEEIKTEKFDDASEVEEKLIKEHLGQIKVEFDEEETAKKLMKVLDNEKFEGEKNLDYEKRVLEEVRKVLNLE
ncbi:hypothetical protein KY345_06120, partial [Candidatus Woesearchaeota archaeon]|nr:hypothetical protein [Candidatus Woesearchaeota archaeon]